MNSVGIQNYDNLLSGKDRLTQAEADRLFCIKLKEAVADAIKFLGADTWSKLDCLFLEMWGVLWRKAARALEIAG